MHFTLSTQALSDSIYGTMKLSGGPEMKSLENDFGKSFAGEQWEKFKSITLLNIQLMNL